MHYLTPSHRCRIVKSDTGGDAQHCSIIHYQLRRVVRSVTWRHIGAYAVKFCPISEQSTVDFAQSGGSFGTKVQVDYFYCSTSIFKTEFPLCIATLADVIEQSQAKQNLLWTFREVKIMLHAPCEKNTFTVHNRFSTAPNVCHTFSIPPSH